MIANCDADVEDIIWEENADDACKVVFTTKTSKACYFDAATVFSGVEKFTGAISIIVGIAMTFYGAKFILYVIGFMIFAAVQGLFATVSYTLGYFDP